ncbi:hypothetical protein VPH35_041374 [Triticum aestivum]
MAQAVIGAMGTLLPKLADLITKEYNLQRGPPDIQVKIWAKDVRDLSYGLEDSIDKFMVRIETDGRPDKSHSFRNFIDKSLSLLTKGKIRHKIGIDIKDIKSRIKEVSDRRDRYKVDNVAAAKPVVPAIDTLRLAALYTKATELVGTDEKSVEMYQNINEASWGEQQLISEIRTFVENKRYLIVIDDIWDKSVWENIKYALIENGYGSRVITTTRVLYVSLQAGGVYRLKPLSVVDSRKLFYQRIYEMENKSPPNQLVEVSERILKRCGGVPLAILAIGSLLSSEKGTTHTHEYWSKVYKSISLGLDNNHDDVKNMRRILSVSYSGLPPHLKTCLLHIGLYQEDYEIEAEQLIWKWVGEEGFVKKEQGKSLYEVGGDYLDELINKSLVQPVKFENANKMCSCRIHDMVRDLIISLSNEENFLTTIGEVANQLSTMGLTHVRSLTVARPAFSLLPTLSGFPVLRVFDLSYRREVDNNNWKDICSLFHLRYLSLMGTSITKIPKVTGNLRFLQLLDIRYTNIEEELPSTFIELTQLLLFYVADSITCAMPRWMCSMSFLFSPNIALETLGEEGIQVLGNIASLNKRLVLEDAYPFRCLKTFTVKGDTMELKFARVAMQSLHTLLLVLYNVHDTLLQFGDLVLGIENLSLLEHIVVEFPFNKEDTETQKVKYAVQKEVKMNQNRPILTFTQKEGEPSPEHGHDFIKAVKFVQNLLMRHCFVPCVDVCVLHRVSLPGLSLSIVWACYPL